jgi:hypothetical protein
MKLKPDAISNIPIAEKYLSSYLVINGTYYQICELEYYHHSAGHPDIFTHCDKEQSENETFYFHRMHGKGFKEGTYKGMDITFGNDNEYGGLLVRSIRKINIEDKSENDNKSEKDGAIIEGPCLVVQEILKAFNYDRVTDFYKYYSGINKKLNVHDNKSGLWISHEQLEGKKKKNKKKEVKFHYSPRVGLKLKGNNIEDLTQKMKYVMKPYRVTTVSDKLKKQKVTIKLTDGGSANGYELDDDKIKSLIELASVKTWKVSDITELYLHYLYYLNKQ